jgi:dipeptidyl aminopeptidase/acylaminoacyl peptidase
MRQKLLRIVAAIAILAIVIYFALGYYLYDRLTTVNDEGAYNWPNTPASFKVQRGPYVKFDTTPYETANFETVQLPSRDAGIILGAWYLPNDPAAPAVVIAHGFNRCKCDANVLTASGMLHRNGFNVLLIDLRNHRDSTRTTGHAAYGNTEYADVLGAWDWLSAQKHIPPSRIGLYGVSMGAATSLIAFAQEPRIPAAFADSSFIDVSELAADQLALESFPGFLAPGGLLIGRLLSGVDLLGHTPRDSIRNDAHRPLYLVHGTTDQRVFIHQNSELAALAQQSGASLTNWVVDGAGHIESEYRMSEEYERRLTAFFRDSLK